VERGGEKERKREKGRGERRSRKRGGRGGVRGIFRPPLPWLKPRSTTATTTSAAVASITDTFRDVA